jgi:hypothetical protein
MAVVNSEKEAKTLRYLYIKYGPGRVQRDDGDEYTEETKPEAPPEETTLASENAIVHIGFHDIFIEGEYLTVRSK